MKDDEFVKETARLFGKRIMTFEETHGLRLTTDIEMTLGDGRVCIIVIREETE